MDEKNAKQVNMVAFIMAFYMDDKSKKDLLINKKKYKQELPTKRFTRGGWNITMGLMGGMALKPSPMSVQAVQCISVFVSVIQKCLDLIGQ